jgi:hypothetical protein
MVFLATPEAFSGPPIAQEKTGAIGSKESVAMHSSPPPPAPDVVPDPIGPTVEPPEGPDVVSPSHPEIPEPSAPPEVHPGSDAPEIVPPLGSVGH